MNTEVTFYRPVVNQTFEMAKRHGVVFPAEFACDSTINVCARTTLTTEELLSRAIDKFIKERGYKTLPVGFIMKVGDSFYYNNIKSLVRVNMDDLKGVSKSNDYRDKDYYLNNPQPELPLEPVLTLDLPRWSQCVCFGESVSIAQADEMIRRMDKFIIGGKYAGGNDSYFNDQANAILGKSGFTHDLPTGLTPEEERAFYKKQNENQCEWEKKWGSIYLDYLGLEFASTSYVGGPFGWVHPNGVISFNQNVGKHASLEYLYKDLVKIAENFPFLHMFISFGDGEYCDVNVETIASFEVCNGTVKAIEPIPMSDAVRIASCEFDFPVLEPDGTRTATDGFGREGIIPLEHIQKWAEKILGKKFGEI